MTARLAVIVGHTATAPGLRMVSPLSVPEYFWNLNIAEEIRRLAHAKPELDLRIFTRDLVGLTRTYKAVNAWKADVAIELHCNGFNGSARGTETLYGVKNPRSKDLATLVQASMSSLFLREGKQNRGIVCPSETDRGYWNVNFADCPSCLVEPFFGDNIEDATRARLKEPEYPRVILETLEAFVKGPQRELPDASQLNS